MVVFVHSLGSLWQQKILPAGGARVWNTTGIRDGPRVRSYAKVFGQVKLGAKARFELSRSGELTGVAWTASDVVDVNRCRKLALLCRASRAAVAEFFIVTVTESLIGELHMDSWDGLAGLIEISERADLPIIRLAYRAGHLNANCKNRCTRDSARIRGTAFEGASGGSRNMNSSIERTWMELARFSPSE